MLTFASIDADERLHALLCSGKYEVFWNVLRLSG